MISESPVLLPNGQARSDDVYSVLLASGDVIWEIWRRFGSADGAGNEHLRYVWRLRWRTFLED